MNTPTIFDRNFSSEFEFATSRSSGPGGQNVNKVNTKVELRFNVVASRLLSEDERILIFEKLKNKINSENILVIACQTTRSQLKNKELVIIKFFKMLEKALHKQKKRKPSTVSEKEKKKRLLRKKMTAEKKELRSKIQTFEE
jgi:ribosome-associated protein